MIGYRGEQQDAHAGRAAHPVHEADAVGAHARPRAASMPPAEGAGCAGKLAAVPAQEQPRGQRHDDHAHGQLRELLYRLGEITTEQDDGNAEGAQRRGVAETPGQAETARAPHAVAVVPGHQRAHRREVVRIGCVAQAEQHGDRDDEEKRLARAQRRDPLVEPEHPLRPRRSRSRGTARPPGSG